jgi:hypothetical protein
MRHPEVVETASTAICIAREVFNDVPATNPSKGNDNAKA